ncbi:hypothetical protein MFIFM68171_08773 [Madurella fahalii]|uniref:Uncharacterized protein n=1 Tax=Madurella fahalii TaxID=1157608 RepID=A0ABQ0GLA8_9PEZI
MMPTPAGQSFQQLGGFTFPMPTVASHQTAPALPGHLTPIGQSFQQLGGFTSPVPGTAPYQSAPGNGYAPHDASDSERRGDQS